MTTVSVVLAPHHVRPAPGPDGSPLPHRRLHQQLIVLAEAGRAAPLWLRVFGHKDLLSRVGKPARPASGAGVSTGLLETAARLLRTAGPAVSTVDLEPSSADVAELRWDTVTAWVIFGPGEAGLAGPAPVTVSAEYGLALAAAAGAPVRLPGAVLDRLAVPVPGEDVLAPFQPAPEP